MRVSGTSPSRWRGGWLWRFGCVYGMCMAVRVVAGLVEEGFSNGLVDPLGALERQVRPAIWIAWLFVAVVVYRWRNGEGRTS